MMMSKEKIKDKENLEEKENKAEEEKVGKHKNKSEEKINELSAKLAELEQQAAMWKNKYYEAYADLDNTRKVIEKDRLDMMKYRAMGFIEKILPTLDNFEMAFKCESDDPKIKNYQVGFKMILKQLISALEEEQVKIIEPKVGDEFDHQTMSAMSTVPGEEDNKVASVYLKGYFLKDRMIRPAMVVVSKKEEQPQKAEENKEE